MGNAIDKALTTPATASQTNPHPPIFSGRCERRLFVLTRALSPPVYVEMLSSASFLSNTLPESKPLSEIVELSNMIGFMKGKKGYVPAHLAIE